MSVPIACILMAAGASVRYNRGRPSDAHNKLLARVGGKRLIDIMLDISLDAGFAQVTAVTRHQEVRQAALERGVKVVWMPALRDTEVRDTIRAGLETVKRLNDVEGVMFAVCDQPWLRPDSVYRLCAAFLECPERIAALGFRETRGNPVIFPRALWAELETLPPGGTGGSVINSHPELVRIVQAADARELHDVDTASDLNKC